MNKRDISKFLRIYWLLFAAIGILVAAIAVVSLEIITSYNTQQQQKPTLAMSASSTIPHVTDTEAFNKYLHTALEEKEPKAVQELLLELYADAEGGEQHMAFHYFGEKLYEVKGVDGLPLCEQWYGFGCYHGFLLDAVDTQGYEVVPFLDEACYQMGRTMDTETCQHGIGHGLLEFSGRNPLKAVAACDLVDDVYSKLGCASGVFMEYFAPTMSNQRTLQSQMPPYDEKNPLDVCSELTGIVQATCLFEIHSWWEDGVHLPPTTVEALCNSVADQEAREFCLIGYGNFKGPYVSNAAPFCDEFVVPESRTLCRAGILWAAEHHNDSPNPTAACTDLEEGYRDMCFEKGRFTCEVERNCNMRGRE